MTRVILILAFIGLAVPISMYLLWFVHCTVERCCVAHARRFCRRKGLEVRRSRHQMAFDVSGEKTEFTMVELDCFDAQKQRRLLLLLVWIFGVRGVLKDEIYPDGYDEKWPEINPAPTEER